MFGVVILVLKILVVVVFNGDVMVYDFLVVVIVLIIVVVFKVYWKVYDILILSFYCSFFVFVLIMG